MSSLAAEAHASAIVFPGCLPDEAHASAVVFPGCLPAMPGLSASLSGPPPAGCVAPRRSGALLLHALHLRSAGGEELDVARRKGRRDDVGEGAHVRRHLGKGADDGDEHPGAESSFCDKSSQELLFGIHGASAKQGHWGSPQSGLGVSCKL